MSILNLTPQGFILKNWKWLLSSILGLAGCAVLGTMLVSERLDHSRTSDALSRTRVELVVSQSQYWAAEQGRLALKDAFIRVRSTLDSASEVSLETQRSIDKALERGLTRSEEAAKMTRKASDPVVSTDPDCVTAMREAEGAWK